MLSRLLVVACVLAGALACDKWPNGTDTKYNWWQCGGDIQISSAVPQDMNNQYEYPIHLGRPLQIVTQANNPTHTYDKLNNTIYVWEWNTNNCGWTTVPTFNMLNNLDACTNGVTCPIHTGRQQLTFIMDFSPYQKIINLLTNDAPYELEYILNNNQIGQALCIVFQARAYVK